jgi:hypothetical protein
VLTTIDPRYGLFVEETNLALAWPDAAGRYELARRFAAARGLALAGDALDNLAAPEWGPRELQGVIARIAAEQLLQRAQ